MKPRTTKVMNVITENSETFFNCNDLETNLISSIILGTEDRGKILNSDYREKITREAKVEYIQSKDGTMKCYSPSYDMIAYEIN